MQRRDDRNDPPIPTSKAPDLRRRAALAFAFCTSVLIAAGCTGEDQSTSSPSGADRTERTDYDVPIRPAAEIASAIGALCTASIAESRPVLVEFSAAWCSDCRKLHGMKQAGPLAQELSHWPNLTINVGRFDQHRDLLAALDVESIAHWAVLEPENCEEPIGAWARRAERTLEVSSGEARDVTPEELATWLRTLRPS